MAWVRVNTHLLLNTLTNKLFRRVGPGALVEVSADSGGGDMLAANNLGDLANFQTSRANLFPSGAITLVGTNGALFGAGGTAANSWPKLTAGTLLTTPEAGALELDAKCLYGTTDAGNRGYIPVRHFIRCNVTRTLPNDTNLNAIFDAPRMAALL